MRNREELETIEDGSLSPWASRVRLGRGRRHPEEDHPFQTAYQVDRERIVHSNAFRRLEYKTQVFVHHEGDHYRNRLTHSLEVAVVSRTLARMLRLNEDLAETVSLAHDLGHPPFGHSGERVLDEVMRLWGGFEHNRQSLRVVEIIEHRHAGFRGLNLSWEVREGIAKHVTEYDTPTGDEYGPGTFPSLEAQVVCLADEIAYSNHDLDDGLASGLITLGALEDVPLWAENCREIASSRPAETPRRLGFATIRRLIDLLIEDAAVTTTAKVSALAIRSPDDARQAPRLAVTLSEGMEARFRELKTFLFENLYRHSHVRAMAVKAEKILKELFSAFLSDRSLLPSPVRAHLTGHSPERVICDYVAGMTDRYALREYRRLFSPEEGVL